MVAKKEETRSFYEQAVRRTVEHVVAHLDDALALDSLAADACLSPFHFHRVFRGMAGETILELARRLRMERAAWHLIDGDRPVTEIAFDAGYESHEAFTRAFRASYSTSPTGFRRRLRARLELAAENGVHFDPEGRAPTFTPIASGGQSMNVEIQELPGWRVAAVRHVGPYNLIHQAFEKLGAIAAQDRRMLGDETRMVALYHDDPESTPLDALRSDAGLTVGEDLELPDGVQEHRIPGGRYARTVHEGSYQRLGDAWARFFGQWLPASGHRIGDGPSFELYLNTPENAAVDDLRTELYIPIA